MATVDIVLPLGFIALQTSTIMMMYNNSNTPPTVTKTIPTNFKVGDINTSKQALVLAWQITIPTKTVKTMGLTIILGTRQLRSLFFSADIPKQVKGASNKQHPRTMMQNMVMGMTMQEGRNSSSISWRRMATMRQTGPMIREATKSVNINS